MGPPDYACFRRTPASSRRLPEMTGVERPRHSSCLPATAWFGPLQTWRLHDRRQCDHQTRQCTASRSVFALVSSIFSILATSHGCPVACPVPSPVSWRTS